MTWDISITKSPASVEAVMSNSWIRHVNLWGEMNALRPNALAEYWGIPYRDHDDIAYIDAVLRREREPGTYADWIKEKTMTAQLDAPPHDPAPEPICRCGHYRSVHSSLRPDMPEAVCNAPNCTCLDFTPVDLGDTPVGRALDEWMTQEVPGPGKVFAEWVKAHGGAERFAKEMAEEVAPQIADMMGHFIQPTPAQKWAMFLWARYYVDCENYDRRICTHRDAEGNAIPLTPAERERCESNAIRQLQRLHADAQGMGLTPHEMREAKKVVSILGHSARLAIADHPPAEDVNREETE